MAIRNKFIHFKTRAAFDSYLETHADDLYNYTTFIKETKEIYTHGQFYKSSNKWAISSLIDNSDYATLAYNNGKVGDIFDMSSGTSVHGILGTINDKKWYIFYKDSIREYIYNTDTKKFTAGATINLANDSEIPDPATVAPKMDGTAAVGSSNKYAREDHVHPSDNTKQDTLVSGESIRTINNLSLLGEGNINVGDVPSITVEHEQIPNETDFNRVAEAAANNRAVLIRIKTTEMTLTSNYWQYTSSESQRGFVAYATYLSETNNITLTAHIIENQPVMVETYDKELQEELVSGTNIKTINGTAILGSGNIDTPDSKVTSAANHYTPVGGSATSGTIINSITKDEKGHIIDIGVANGIDAGKITSGVIDIERLPKGALERLVIVANKAARLALTTEQVQEGDTVKEKDTGHMYFVIDSSKLNSEDGYSIYTAGAASSVPWSGVTGKPDLVNSVKLVLPSSIFINSGSTLTGNAELGSSLSTQNANTVWAAPSGTSGVPTFRKLTFLDMNTVTSDEFNYIPQTFKGGRLVINYKNSAGGQNTDNTITEYQFGDGASNLTYITAKGFKTSENHGHRVLCSNGSSKLLYGPSTPGTAGQVLISNGSSTPEWGKVPITSIGGPTVDTATSNTVPYGITSYIGEYRSDKLAFIKSTDLYGEISKNNGESWTEDPQGSSRLISLFTSQDNKYGLQLIDTEDVSTTTQYRLTINNSDRYCTIDWIYIYVSTNGSGYNCFIEAYNPSSESWDIISKDAVLQGWSGPNFRALTSSIYYNNSPSTASQYSKLRFTFSTRSVSENHGGQLTVYRISGYGTYGWRMPNNTAKVGQIYSWDNAQNVSFPGSVSAWKFISNGGTSTNVTMGDGSLKDLKTKQLVVNGTINNFYSSDSVEVRLYAPTSGGTSGQILVSNGNNAPNWASLDSLGYLPLTGGTISGSLRVSGHINPVNNGVSNIGERGKKFKDIYATTLHGNFNESTTFAAPHPNPIYIDNTNNSTDGVYLVLKNKGVYVSSFGTTNETTNYIETFMLHRKSDQSNSYKLSIRDDGNAYIRGKIIATQEWVTNNISGLSTNISSQGSVIASLGRFLITGADANATTTTSTVKIKLKQIGRSTATSASAFGSPSLESSGVTIPAATTTTAGVMTATDKSNLNTAYSWGNHASAGYLKGIPEATSGSYGGIKIGYQAADKSYAVQLDSNGKAYVNVPWEKGTGTITQINAGLGMKPKLITGSGTLDLSLRSSTQMSLSSQNASTVSGKVYAVQLDKDGYLGVSVPWTDTNTNYYPTTFTWTNGTSKGPTGSLTGTGMSAVSFGSIPIASLSNSGVITTEAQEISGEKYFNNGVFVGLSGSVSRGIIDGKAFGYDGLAIVSDSNVYIAPDNNIVYFGYDGDTYIQDGVFSGTASKANMVTGALTIHSGSTNITYNGSKTEEITIPRNRQTNLTRQAYGSDPSISVKKGKCYYHNTGSLWATSINLSLNTADWSSIESINDTEIIETSMVVVESAYPVTFSSNSMLKVQKDIPLTGDAGTYRVYVFSRITPTLVAVNCAVYKAS